MAGWETSPNALQCILKRALTAAVIKYARDAIVYSPSLNWSDLGRGLDPTKKS